jgi:hypothetical protein
VTRVTQWARSLAFGREKTRNCGNAIGARLALPTIVSQTSEATVRFRGDGCAARNWLLPYRRSKNFRTPAFLQCLSISA